MRRLVLLSCLVLIFEKSIIELFNFEKISIELFIFEKSIIELFIVMRLD